MPDLSPEPGWEPANFGPHVKGSYSFVSGEPEGQRIRLKFYGREDGALMAKVWFGPACEGPPGHAHGGSTAAVLDEGMGFGAWHAGHGCVAIKISVSYRAMIPLGSVVTLEAMVESVKGSKVKMRARLYDRDGKDYARAEGLFLKLPDERWRQLYTDAGKV